MNLEAVGVRPTEEHPPDKESSCIAREVGIEREVKGQVHSGINYWGHKRIQKTISIQPAPQNRQPEIVGPTTHKKRKGIYTGARRS